VWSPDQSCYVHCYSTQPGLDQTQSNPHLRERGHLRHLPYAPPTLGFFVGSSWLARNSRNDSQLRRLAAGSHVF
jgi:hypothetical protein